MRTIWGILAGILAATTEVALGATQLQVRVLQANGEHLPEAVVYASPIDQAVPISGENAILNQKEERFLPHVLPVQKGTRVLFTNEDDINHHVYSFSPAKRLNLRIPAGEIAGPLLFGEPGEVVLGCNVHDWMLAYIHVVDTPWFATTNAEGYAHIEGMPEGRYQLRIWHPRAAEDLSMHDHETAFDGQGEHEFRLSKPVRPARQREAPEFDY